ncbi:ribokinase [Devosia rhodophyticola]|uniref:Ribokinase n=1 Tax=Devosia rhodophyticola TaxID=3026423 RepID=A0ABY7Z2E1_9HYPH|nr:ribokinase [Devosia rhodophyticola]WDR07269.1 ribokinase [Devosia rhodophyticola]
MISVFGSTNLDQVGTVSRLPQPGETVAGGTFSMAAGGKGANQALAARRAGAEVRHFSAVGSDAFADIALEKLRGDGVDLAGVRTVDGSTGIAMIFVDGAGENVIAVLPGANGELTPADAEAALADMQKGSILLLQQEIPQAATARALALAREKGVIAILNTAPFLSDTPAQAANAAITVANETEFALLCGDKAGELDTMMRDWAKTHNQTIIVTLGPNGAKAATPDQLIAVDALKVTPVDTVGAGDTFCGYLAAALDAGLPLEQAMRRAAYAGSLACLNPGAQPAIPYGKDVDAALAKA